MALSVFQQDVLNRSKSVVEKEVRPKASEIDRTRQYPTAGLKALGQAGLLGLMVPQQYGGLGGDLQSLALTCEEVGRGCASTGMTYLMHQCGAFLIAAKANAEQGERFLRPMAKGEAIGTLAFSERGTGAHFYNPEIRARKNSNGFILDGRKSFVTSGGHADLYPMLVRATGDQGLDVLVVPKTSHGLGFEGEWDGMGMAGNASIALTMQDVHVPKTNIIGDEGEGQALVFNVVAPSFLLGLAGVNVGIAQAALDAALDHAKTRTYPPDNKPLAAIQAIQFYIAEMSAAVDSARALLGRAAAAADGGEPTALLLVIESKIVATEAAIAVTNLAMQVCGGQGYTRRLPVERHLRDARAGSVMAPTNEVLKEWLGKSLAGLPLF